MRFGYARHGRHRIAGRVWRRLSKGITNLQKAENQYYSFVRIKITLLTSDLFCDILSLLLGGKQLNRHFMKWRR
jgi:hypothetical protein